MCKWPLHSCRIHGSAMVRKNKTYVCQSQHVANLSSVAVSIGCRQDMFCQSVLFMLHNYFCCICFVCDVWKYGIFDLWVYVWKNVWTDDRLYNLAYLFCEFDCSVAQDLSCWLCAYSNSFELDLICSALGLDLSLQPLVLGLSRYVQNPGLDSDLTGSGLCLDLSSVMT